LYTGIFAVSILPTTIFSCIVFTQDSGGNFMAPGFNAAFGKHFLGVVLSPLLQMSRDEAAKAIVGGE
jgi:predicted Na+-dependent transporter